MGAALETVTGYQSPGTTTAGTYTTFTVQNGQSFTVRATPTDQAGEMFAPFASFGAAGYLQIKSARMHDQTIGTTFAVAANSAFPQVNSVAGLGYDEPTWNTDVLTVQATTVASQTASTSYLAGMQMYYPSLGGIQQNMMTWAQVQQYINPGNKTGLHYVSWVRPASSGTAGVLGTGVAINATNDQFKANHSYALVGYLAPTSVGAVLVQGTDTGNLYVGGPGSSDPVQTRDFFRELSDKQGIPSIPIVQANNKGNTLVYVADPATTSTTFTIGLIWIDLGTNVPPVGS